MWVVVIASLLLGLFWIGGFSLSSKMAASGDMLLGDIFKVLFMLLGYAFIWGMNVLYKLSNKLKNVENMLYSLQKEKKEDSEM